MSHHNPPKTAKRPTPPDTHNLTLTWDETPARKPGHEKPDRKVYNVHKDGERYKLLHDIYKSAFKIFCSDHSFEVLQEAGIEVLKGTNPDHHGISLEDFTTHSEEHIQRFLDRLIAHPPPAEVHSLEQSTDAMATCPDWRHEHGITGIKDYGKVKDIGWTGHNRTPANIMMWHMLHHHQQDFETMKAKTVLDTNHECAHYGTRYELKGTEPTPPNVNAEGYQIYNKKHHQPRGEMGRYWEDKVPGGVVENWATPCPYPEPRGPPKPPGKPKELGPEPKAPSSSRNLQSYNNRLAEWQKLKDEHKEYKAAIAGWEKGPKRAFEQEYQEWRTKCEKKGWSPLQAGQLWIIVGGQDGDAFRLPHSVVKKIADGTVSLPIYQKHKDGTHTVGGERPAEHVKREQLVKDKTRKITSLVWPRDGGLPLDIGRDHAKDTVATEVLQERPYSVKRLALPDWEMNLAIHNKRSGNSSASGSDHSEGEHRKGKERADDPHNHSDSSR